MENTDRPSLPEQLRQHPFALGTALLVGLAASHPLLGTLLFIAMPLVAIWAIVTLVHMARRPRERRVRGTLMAAWVLALSIPATIQLYYAHAVRARANAVVAAVDAYRAGHGRYPATLAEAGLDEADLTQRWRVWYRAERNVPALFHRSTLTVFDVYDYDFERREWRYRPD